MSKIKLNLVSGAIVEKPLICAFKANNIEYVVLDNEMNGSMGLPIILVCKLENGKLIKIVDQNEWQIVKEYLKNIIAGSQVELVRVASEMPADDIYYTQLTLPLPSFDALKNAYKIEDGSASDSEVGATPVEPGGMEAAPVEPSVTPEPVNPTPIKEPAPQDIVMPTPEAVSPVTPSPMEAPTTEVTPTPVSEPVVPNPMGPAIDLGINPPSNDVPVSPVTPEVSPVEAPQAPVMPTIEPVSPVAPSEPAVTPVESPASNDNVFQEQKEAFMQACENMFDALVQKFERELEKK